MNEAYLSLRQGCECGANPDNLGLLQEAILRALEIHLHSVFIPLKQILTTAVYFKRGRVGGIRARLALWVKGDALLVGFKRVDFSQQVTEQCLPGNTVALLKRK